MLGQTGAVEDVVAQNHGAPVLPDELLPQDEGLGKPVRGGLDLVRKPDAELLPASQEPLEVRQVLGGGDDEDVPDAGQHKGGQRVVDHGLVVDGQQLLGHRFRHGV